MGLDILRTDLFVTIWKIIVFLLTGVLLSKIGKSAMDSWKKSGGSIISVLDEVFIGLLVIAVFFLFLSTDLATIVSKIMPTIGWIMNILKEAFTKITRIPIG